MSVKIAFLSFAHMHANGWARQMLTMPKGTVEFTGIWDRDLARAKKMAKALGTKAFASREALLARKLHGAVICSENVNHRDDAIACAQAGVGVMCEKPLATSVADARAMVEACRNAGVPLMTAFPCRFYGPALRLKEQVDAGELGEVLGGVTTNHGRQPGGWFANPKLSGGGAVTDHTVHIVDFLRWLMGREFKRVYAAVGYNRFKLTRKAVGKHVLDDAGVLSLEMDGGAVFSLDCSWSRPEEYSTWGDAKVELVGTKGVARMDLFRQRLLLASSGTKRLSERCWADEKDFGIAGEFIRTLREGRPPSVSGIDGLRATEVVEAAYRSAQLGEPVALPLA